MTCFPRIAVLFALVAIALLPEDAHCASVESAAEPRLARSIKDVSDPSQTASIDELIDQLGSDQYFLRRRAEQALVTRGADAFDRLQQAEGDPDVEIAMSAHYILQQIRIEWTHADDSADVQSIMHRYGDLSKDERKEKVDQLLSLPNDQGLGAACRIAHFESSAHRARYAALKVLLRKSSPESGSGARETIATEIGDSQRTSARWLRTYAEQLTQRDRVLDDWLKLIDEETALVEEDSAETEASFVFELIDFQLGLCRDRKAPQAAFAALRRRTDLYVGSASDRLRAGLVYAMNWLWENEQWEALELFEDHYGNAIREDRLLVYFSAAARWKQGRDEQAEEFAERAFSLEANDVEDRLTIGELIGEMGRHDWAEREWWYVVEKAPVLDRNSLYARRSLATLRLHDRGEDKRAAELMAEICDAIEENSEKKDSPLRDAGRRKLYHEFFAQREFFLACQAATDGDHDAQRTHLSSAYGFDPNDVDVLIAMYRSRGADQSHRQTTVSRIQAAAKRVANRIEQDPDNAQHYNHWAWLISNTEGDYAQAVKHSLHSLELVPDSPSYLDTLGRCYYAAGDLDKAVEAQREAVRRHPHLQVMRDQLQLFETALAEHEKK